jgi:predicted DNA-binding ribbon-helix-helix protein
MRRFFLKERPAADTGRIGERSVVVSGERIGIRMEDSFWRSLEAIVRMERTTIEHFLGTVMREHDGLEPSSSLRVAVLRYFQHLAANNIAVRGDMDRMIESATTGEGRRAHGFTANPKSIFRLWRKIKWRRYLPGAAKFCCGSAGKVRR